MKRIRDWVSPDDLRIVPANEAAFDDIRTILGNDGRRCMCQRFKLDPREFYYGPSEPWEALLREQTHCGDPAATQTSGIVAYLDDDPVGWCAVEPRTAYPGLGGRRRVVWAGRDEDRHDSSVWSVTCITVRLGFRHLGIMHALAAAAVEHARSRGARAVEGYGMLTEPGKEITWGELHVGSVEAFEAAGMERVTHPTPRRVVLRKEFG